MYSYVSDSQKKGSGIGGPGIGGEATVSRKSTKRGSKKKLIKLNNNESSEEANGIVRSSAYRETKCATGEEGGSRERTSVLATTLPNPSWFTLKPL